MKTSNAIIMKEARETLKGNWLLAVGTFALYSFINFIPEIIPKFGVFIPWLILGPMSLGVSMFSLSLLRKENPNFEKIFDGFKNFWVALLTYFAITLFTLLWTLLLIIPGIIASLSYSMTFYILADNKTLRPLEAIKLSKKMMKGFKRKLFLLHLRFFGWLILSVLTLGIGFLWLVPYIQISVARFYEDLKNNQAVPSIV
jgi:uncharacterized membrane protein